MKDVLITGSGGFIGLNLKVALERLPGIRVFTYEVGDPPNKLDEALAEADIVFHLAGVNRPEKEEDFIKGNVGAAEEVTERLRTLRVKPAIVVSSSIQATLENPYGISKRLTEREFEAISETLGISVRIFRLPNVFGKWCRPNYNSAVATFCHNIARGLEITISDPARKLELVYIDDVVTEFISQMRAQHSSGAKFERVLPTFEISLGEVVDRIRSFESSRRDLLVPDMSDELNRRLYATYLSYLDGGNFRYLLARRSDDRGSLAELLKSPHFGQIFVSRTLPGITRGNHYHDTKCEKFVVLEGQAVIRFRHVVTGDLTEYLVSGHEYSVVDIPPGYSHSIENVGDGEMVVLFWASAIFDAAAPDTYSADV